MNKNQKENKNKEVAIRVENVSKIFRIPHEKHTTLKQAALNLFSPKTYEVFNALQDVSFEVKQGEFFGIIGKNGSGKSTLLKILAGIYTPDRGNIRVNGKLSPFLELGVGFNPELTARENVFLGGAILGLSRDEISEKFDSIIEFAELEEFIDLKFKNFSSGMQVRLAFALAINAHAEVLLMDEVLAVGDSNFQAKCISEFNKYRVQGKTVLLVTHDIATVQRYCNKAMLLRNGKIMKIGDAEDVGNEYIHQNMSDEEKRLHDQQKKENDMNTIKSKVGKSKSKKIAEITKVEFLDKDGKGKNVFETGDDLSIKVYFKKNKNILDINFGIALFDQENKYIFGINTIIDKVDTKEYLKKGYFRVDYINIPLKNNTYYVKAAIFGGSDAVHYDFLDKSNVFKIFSNSKNQGLIELNYKWQ